MDGKVKRTQCPDFAAGEIKATVNGEERTYFFNIFTVTEPVMHKKEEFCAVFKKNRSVTFDPNGRFAENVKAR